MIPISMMVVGETRTWNSDADDDLIKLKDIMRQEGFDLKIYGCTWDYCTYPEKSECFEKIFILNFQDNQFRKSKLAEYAEEYTNIRLNPFGLSYEDDKTFFWNWSAQYCQWAYMIEYLYNNTDTQYVIKHRWDHTVRGDRHDVIAEQIRRSIDRMDDSVPSLDVCDIKIYHHSDKSLRDVVQFGDIIWGANREYLKQCLNGRRAEDWILEGFTVGGRIDIDHMLLMKLPPDLVIYVNYSEDCWEKIGGYTEEVQAFTDLGDVGKNLERTNRLKT